MKFKVITCTPTISTVKDLPKRDLILLRICDLLRLETSEVRAMLICSPVIDRSSPVNGDVRTGQDRAGEERTGQGRAGQGRAGQGRAD